MTEKRLDQQDIEDIQAQLEGQNTVIMIGDDNY